MKILKRIALCKYLALFLAFVLVSGDVSVYSQSADFQAHFARAVRDYKAGDFQATADRLVRLLEFVGKAETDFSGWVYLLLGAANEKLGNRAAARVRYAKARELLQDPVIDGLSLKDLPDYCRVFDIDAPAKAQRITNKKSEESGNASKPSRRVITRVGKKKKKKFPILLVVLGVAAVAAAALLLGGGRDDSGSGNQPSPEPTPDYSQEVFDSIKWVHVAAGEFRMGSNDGNSDEQPVHKVYLDAYKISKYEITFDQYDRFCDASGSPKPNDNGWGRGSRPVINVSWNDAKAFCGWLSSNTGRTVRLPTEAEWEKAARGGNNSRGYTYSGSNNVGSVAWYGGNSGGKTHPVGQKSSNELGIHDMSGNVWEWCADWYYSDYYKNSTYRNPTGPSWGSNRVLRGGSWLYYADSCRSANRYDYYPSYRDHFLGFRPVMEP